MLVFPCRRWARLPVVVFLFFACGAFPALAEDWATRLGYPAGKKVVIVHAHNAGMCYETTAACLGLSEALPQLSMSLMPPCPWFPHAARHADELASGDVGLQLTLNSEWDEYRWGPTSGANLSPSLVDRDGNLWRSVLQLALSADIEDVQREMQWQLLTAERNGLRPTHLTTHLGALYARPDLAAAYLDFARKSWIPAVVVELTPELAERFASEGVPIAPQLAGALDDYPLPMLKDFRILAAAESFEEKKAALLGAINDLPVGLSQLAFAPAIESPALKAITPVWQQFDWDRALLEDEEVRRRLEADDIVLTNWVEVMQRFDN